MASVELFPDPLDPRRATLPWRAHDALPQIKRFPRLNVTLSARNKAKFGEEVMNQKGPRMIPLSDWRMNESTVSLSSDVGNSSSAALIAWVMLLFRT
jgi:hypothetical protein